MFFELNKKFKVRNVLKKDLGIVDPIDLGKCS